MYITRVGSVRHGIVFFLDLLQCRFGSRVDLELEYIYMFGTFEYAVYPPMACLLLNISVVFAEQQHDEVKGVLPAPSCQHTQILLYGFAQSFAFQLGTS